MDYSKNQNKTPETDPKEMQTYELPDKECKITQLPKREHKQLNEIRKMWTKWERDRNYKKQPNK